MDGTAKTASARPSDDWEETKDSEENDDEEEEGDVVASLPRFDYAKDTAPKSLWQIHQENNLMHNLNVNRYVYVYAGVYCIYD